MRAAIVVLLALTSTASADRGGFVEASAGVSYGSLSRTTTESGFEYGDFVTVEEGSGRGEDVRITGGFELNNGVRLGGFFRVGFLQMDIENYYAGGTDPTRLRTILLGASVAKALKHGLYGRADAGLGSHKQSTYGGTYWPRSDSVLMFSVEGGLEREVLPRWRVQVGLALLFQKIHYLEYGDAADYTYDTRIIAPSFVVTVGRDL